MSSLSLPGGVAVGALAVVNVFGDVLDPDTGQILAGLRDGPNGTRLLDTGTHVRAGVRPRGHGREATTLVAVASNARVSKMEATTLAQQAQLGLAWTIRPVHPTLDGTTIFALATGRVAGNLDPLGVVATDAVTQAAD